MLFCIRVIILFHTNNPSEYKWFNLFCIHRLPMIIWPASVYDYFWFHMYRGIKLCGFCNNCIIPLFSHTRPGNHKHWMWWRFTHWCVFKEILLQWLWSFPLICLLDILERFIRFVDFAILRRSICWDLMFNGDCDGSQSYQMIWWELLSMEIELAVVVAGTPIQNDETIQKLQCLMC